MTAAPEAPPLPLFLIINIREYTGVISQSTCGGNGVICCSAATYTLIHLTAVPRVPANSRGGAADKEAIPSDPVTLTQLTGRDVHSLTYGRKWRKKEKKKKLRPEACIISSECLESSY